jgi:hypothetical protein
MKTILSPRITRRLALASAIGLAALSGCGNDTTPVPTPADQGEARKTLDQALSAWQKGVTVEGMKKESPSILVADPRWEKGVALKKFEVRGDGKPSGAEQVFAVTLWLSDSGGAETKEPVEFRVGTKPILTVFRALF